MKIAPLEYGLRAMLTDCPSSTDKSAEPNLLRQAEAVSKLREKDAVFLAP